VPPEARPAETADAAGIARVHVGSWQGAYGHVFPPETLAGLSVADRERQWGQWLADLGGRSVFVTEDAGEVVAFASVGPAADPEFDRETTGELYAIYALPAAWGRGFGRALMEAALGRLRADGYTAAMLWVLEDNPRARAFYEAAGWRLDGRSRTETRLGTRTSEVRYRIAL
jgi:GNAT superfamily N-acetyltransferase